MAPALPGLPFAALYVAQTSAGGALPDGFARWNGSAWGPTVLGAKDGITSLAVWRRSVYIGGPFTAIDGTPFGHIARWNGTDWLALGAGLSGSVSFMVVYQDTVAVGGGFTASAGQALNYVARWNGTAWAPLGGGTNSNVNHLVEDPATGYLYAGGGFTAVEGGTPANRVACWNGAQWQALGDGVNDFVSAMAIYNGALYIGGGFTVAGGVPANYFASWILSSSTWSAVGGGTSDVVGVLLEFRGLLYMGGEFVAAGAVSASHIATWNGTDFAAVGAGTDAPVHGLILYEGTLVVAGPGRGFPGGRGRPGQLHRGVERLELAAAGGRHELGNVRDGGRVRDRVFRLGLPVVRCRLQRRCVPGVRPVPRPWRQLHGRAQRHLRLHARVGRDHLCRLRHRPLRRQLHGLHGVRSARRVHRGPGRPVRLPAGVGGPGLCGLFEQRHVHDRRGQLDGGRRGGERRGRSGGRRYRGRLRRRVLAAAAGAALGQGGVLVADVAQHGGGRGAGGFGPKRLGLPNDTAGIAVAELDWVAG